jgi:MYXO-CTERM domain-containing protein
MFPGADAAAVDAELHHETPAPWPILVLAGLLASLAFARRRS